MEKGNILTTAQMKQEILTSHQRSFQYGISREERSSSQKKLSPEALDERRAANGDFLDVVSGYIEEFYHLLSPRQFMMAVVDRDGYILNIEGSDEIKAECAQRNCAPGYCWTEKNVGTTAISLCLKKQVPIQLNDKDHYCRRAHGFTSSAAPIFGAENHLQGILVVSGISDLVHPHTLIMITSAARSIEKHLRLLRRNREMSLYTGFLDNVVASAETGLIAVDRDLRIWKSNRKANEILRQANMENEPISVLKGLNLDLKEIRRDPRAWQEKECHIRCKGSRVHIICSARPVLSPQKKELLGAVLVFEEMGKIRKLAERISGSQAYFTFDHLIGDSPAFEEARDMARRAARTPSTVLLLGETGTGKELFAQAIHNAGAAPDKPFIPINCGAVPGELMESELFGYVDGAFTGALKGGRPGKFELADGGTILLDEIGDMPHDMQVKLLRVLQTGEVQRIGADGVIKVNTRIIAATHVDLDRAMAENRFRRDLFYRLNILPITIPPLRERGRRDILALARHFISQNGRRCRLTPDAVEALAACPWPGNARELENTIQRSLHNCEGTELFAKHLALPRLRHPAPPAPEGTLREMECALIRSTLSRTEYNMAATARKLGISRATLYRKVKTCDIPLQQSGRR